MLGKNTRSIWETLCWNTTRWQPTGRAGGMYTGLILDWDYKRRQDLSMPKYVKKALKQFQHVLKKRQHQLFPSAKIEYGPKKQYAKQQSTAPLLDDERKTFIQRVCGFFLFLGRAVGSTLLCPINAISLQSVAPTEDTMKHTLQLLDYIATQKDAVLTFNASAMKLAVHSDAIIWVSQRPGAEQVGTFSFQTKQACQETMEQCWT